MGMRQYLKCGRRTHVLERYMNVLCGVSAADDTLPDRFLTEAVTKHPVHSVVPIKKMVKAYYRKKGYSQEGIPTERLLAALEIEI
ncbi:MAG: aldehyde ferredoxin oxidoreductase C-terminal domain-containing protein, partial [Spirochaetes bacterium]|nr:aldehyde ferredoxin oxidoreductase C-terminal domain-containing protein [Spirochaetota bacterium]